MGQGRQVEARPWRRGQAHLFTRWPRIPDQLMKSVLQCLCCVHFHSAKLLNAYCFLPSQLACLSPDPLQVAGLESSWVISLLFSDSRPPAIGFALLLLQLRFHTHCLSPPCKELWLPYPQDPLAFAWGKPSLGMQPSLRLYLPWRSSVTAPLDRPSPHWLHGHRPCPTGLYWKSLTAEKHFLSIFC